MKTLSHRYVFDKMLPPPVFGVPVVPGVTAIAMSVCWPAVLIAVRSLPRRAGCLVRHGVCVCDLLCWCTAVPGPAMDRPARDDRRHASDRALVGRQHSSRGRGRTRRARPRTSDHESVMQRAMDWSVGDLRSVARWLMR
jgi:hypothetical protein